MIVALGALVLERQMAVMMSMNLGIHEKYPEDNTENYNMIVEKMMR